MCSLLLAAAGTSNGLQAARASESVDGAFGLDFGVPAVRSQLGASTLTPPDLPHRPFDGEYAETSTGWYRFIPTAVPQQLREAEFFVLLTEADFPVLVFARLVDTGCEDVYPWLIESLSRKYSIQDDPAILPRQPYLRAASFAIANRQMDVACGTDLVLAYTDLTAVVRWQQEQQAAREARDAERRRVAEVAQRIERAQAREFADTFTHGEKLRLDGGLGVVFGEPFAVAVPHLPDKPFPVVLEGLSAPFDSGSYQLTLDPEDVPIKLEGELPDPGAIHFERLTQALRAKYGAPIKDTDRHRIFRINGNYFTLRRTSGGTDFALIDTRAQKAAEARAAALVAAETAAAEERFRRETEGL